MNLRLESPEWLWLLAAIVPLGIVAYLAFAAMSRARRVASIVVRLLLLACLSLMLAEISSIRRTDKAAVIAVIDTSASVRAFVPELPDTKSGASMSVLDAVRERLIKAVGRNAGGQTGADDRFVVVIVADGAATALAPTPRAATAERWTQPLVASTVEGTDLAAGIRAATANAPPDTAARILLISDGNETNTTPVGGRSPALDAARAAATQTIPVDVVPLRYDLTAGNDGEVIVDRLDAPTRAAPGAAATLTAVIDATTPTTGTLRLLQEERPSPIGPNGELSLRVSLTKGRNTIPLHVTLTGGRLHRFECVFEPERDANGLTPGDRVNTNNRALAFTTSPGAGSVLVIDGTGSAGASNNTPGMILPNLLRARGFEVVITGPAGLPTDLLRMQSHDLVILQDVPAEEVSDAAQRTLATFVTDLGGGLVMTGGKNSFGAGGWRGTPIEPILPVTLDLPDRLVTPAAAVVLILDSSGSMSRGVLGSARSQQQIANRGAVEALRRLNQDDLFGVIEFSNRASWVVPFGPNTDPRAAAEKIIAITPDGGTNLPPAMEKALDALTATGIRASSKHVIILTDGESQGRGKLPALAQRMRDAGITISTIAVGDEADTKSLENVARIGGGEYFRVTDPNVLPKIFLKAVQITRTPMWRDEPFTPVFAASASPFTAGIDPRSMPPLGGLTLTQPKLGNDKKTIEGVTYSLLTAKGEPVLAHWQSGLGRVAAFTSDTHDWGKTWQAWPDAATLWSQLVRTIARPSSAQMLDLTTHLDGDRVVIRVDAADERGHPIEQLTAPASVYSPDGTRLDTTLTQTSPGVYGGAVSLSKAGNAGTYVVAVAPRRGGSSGVGGVGGSAALAPVFGGVVKPPGAEFRNLRSNDALLTSIAKETGGRVFTFDQLATIDATTLFNRDAITPRETRQPLWPWLIAASIALFLFDVAMRRVAWDRYLDPAYGGTFREELADAARERGEQAAGLLSALRSRATKVAPGAVDLTPIKRNTARANRTTPPNASIEKDSSDTVVADTRSTLLAAKQKARDKMGQQ